MNPLLFIIFLLVLAILFLIAWIVLGKFRTQGSLARALNMSLFLITVPRETIRPGSGQASDSQYEKQLIAVMEQLYSSFTNLHSKGWNKFLYGEPYIALEMAVHHVGEEILFYIALPKAQESIIEKQIHGVYPLASVEKVKDYNIFNPNGVALGAYAILQHDPVLPFKTYQQLESDPLGQITNAMSKLEHEGEGAALQILLRPSHQSIVKSRANKVARMMQQGKSLKQALVLAHQEESRAAKLFREAAGEISKKPQEQKPPEAPAPVIQSDQEIIKTIQNKASKPAFDCNVRILVSALTHERAEQLLREMEGAFVQFDTPDTNRVKLNRVSGKYLEKLVYNFSFRLFNESTKIYLSNEELVSLFHMPLGSSTAPRVKFLKAKPAPAPTDIPKEGISLGVNEFRGVKTAVRMTEEDRRRHLYIIGQTGTGKSTFMKALLRQDIEQGKGVCLIDPHGEFAEFVLSIVSKARAEEVIYFDPGDIERPMGLNMLEIDPTHPEQKTMVIDELFGIFDKLYDLKQTGGPMFEKYFKNSAYLLLDDYQNHIPVLADISRVLVDDKFRTDKLNRETNPLVKEFWQLEAQKATGEQSLSNIAPYISSKLTSFVYNEFLRPIINQPKSAFNFRDVMDNGKILVVNLSKGKIGDLNANLLGMVIVGKLLRAALSRVDIADEKARKDFYLYIDEFQNFTTDSIGIILSEARKYRLDLIIAHQFIKQLKENIRDAVFGNAGSIVAFRIGPDDAEYMKNKFEPVFTPQDLMNIDNLNAYVSMLINGQTTRPFNMKLETERVFGAGSREIAQALKELSKLKFGRDRAEVEEEIKKGYSQENDSSSISSLSAPAV